MDLLLALMLSLFTRIDADQLGVREGSIAPAKFQYDATEAKDRRRSPKIYTSSEDIILDAGKRSKLIANSRDINRNYSIAGWAVRRHLDYVATFHFRSKNGNALDKAGKDLDLQIEAIITEAAKKANFDRAERHPLASFLRLAEARTVLDGDVGILRLKEGRVQGVESDRIKNPAGESGSDWTHGVRTDGAGKALQYSIFARKRTGGMEWERNVSAADLYLLGYYDRFDQIRGIAPIASGLNQLRDTYENFSYALGKAKIAQLLGLKFTRAASDSPGIVSEEAGTGDPDNPDESDDEPRYKVDLGGGPWALDMEPGDDVTLLTDQNPSTQFQQFMVGVIQVALKALDIPMSFFDESYTNFYGSRGAWLHYMRACKPKRDRLVEFLNWWAQWQLQLAILDGRLVLPGQMTIDDLKWEWVPAGQPWWDPSKEINGHLQAVGGAFDNPERIAKEMGTDAYDNIDATARVMAYAAEKGVPLSFAPVVQPVVVKEVDEDV